MKFLTLCLVLVVTAFGAVELSAQGKPNFSGRWTAVGSPQGLRELTLKQDGSTLTLEGQPDLTKRTFKLDGSETEMRAQVFSAQSACLSQAISSRRCTEGHNR